MSWHWWAWLICILPATQAALFPMLLSPKQRHDCAHLHQRLHMPSNALTSSLCDIRHCKVAAGSLQGVCLRGTMQIIMIFAHRLSRTPQLFWSQCFGDCNCKPLKRASTCPLRPYKPVDNCILPRDLMPISCLNGLGQIRDGTCLY